MNAEDSSALFGVEDGFLVLLLCSLTSTKDKQESRLLVVGEETEALQEKWGERHINTWLDRVE